MKMLKKRLIPKILIENKIIAGHEYPILVTTHQFDKRHFVGDPVSQARIYQAQLVDELIFLNIDKQMNSITILLDILKSVSKEVFMPITVGGGVREITHVKHLLSHGADKVSINSAALKNPLFISDVADIFGSQCVVVSIDYTIIDDVAYVVDNGQVRQDLSLIEWLKKCESLKAGEFLLTSVDNDGTSSGMDVDIANLAAKTVSRPIIFSGGCGLTSHFIDIFKKTDVDAIAAATYFCHKDENPMQTRAQIHNAGIPIRTCL